MSTIDQYVINQVLKNIAYYVVPISINLSGSTFSDPKEHEIILDKLSKETFIRITPINENNI